MEADHRDRMIHEVLELAPLLLNDRALRCLPGHVLVELHQQIKSGIEWAQGICSGEVLEK